MEQVIQLLQDNIEWTFSGIGVFALSGIGFLLFNKGGNQLRQRQKSGDNSINLQAAGNVEFTQKNGK